MESTRLFAAICNSCWFIQTMIILFLNKTDLFLDKIKRKKSIKTCFEEYSGKFVYSKFKAGHKLLYHRMRSQVIVLFIQNALKSTTRDRKLLYFLSYHGTTEGYNSTTPKYGDNLGRPYGIVCVHLQ